MSAGYKESTTAAAQVQTAMLAVCHVEPGGCWPLSLCPHQATGDAPAPAVWEGAVSPWAGGHLLPPNPLLLAGGAEADVGRLLSWGLWETRAELPKHHTEAPAICAWSGFCGSTSSHRVSHSPPFWGWSWGEIYPLIGSAFSASLFSWYPADTELHVWYCGEHRKLSYI